MDKKELTDAALDMILASGVSVETAAREHGVSTSTIYYRARLDTDYGERLYARQTQTTRRRERQDQYLSALAQGKTLNDAARDAGVNASTARYWRQFDADYRARLDRARVEGMQAAAAAAAAELESQGE